MKPVIIAFAVAALVGGCTSISVNKVDASRYQPKFVCIERNPKVIVSDFTSVVQSEFLNHGIATAIYEKDPPLSCEYTLSYTALQSWDLDTYLSYAELNLTKDQLVIATARYKHSGGFALNKWASTQTKLAPVIDELLADFSK